MVMPDIRFEDRTGYRYFDEILPVNNLVEKLFRDGDVDGLHSYLFSLKIVGRSFPRDIYRLRARYDSWYSETFSEWRKRVHLGVGDPARGLIQSRNCFIASAVYGDSDAPEVDVLRDFRDNVLVDSTLGRTLANFYYSGFGERVANYIREEIPCAIPWIRKGLDYLVERYISSKIS